jgi:hypothetical protein
VTVTTPPPGLGGVSVTYDGSLTPPTNAGSYAVVASLTHDRYDAPVASATLVIRKATATLTLGPLAFGYGGNAKPVGVTISPPGLGGVSVTYNGASAPPIIAGVHTVVASLAHANYEAAQATGTLTITNQMPSVATLLPAQVVAGDDGFSLRLVGTNFVSGAVVWWNGSARTTVFLSGTELTAGIDASDIARAWNANVVVQNPWPAVADSPPALVIVNNPIPAISGIAPGACAAGPAGCDVDRGRRSLRRGHHRLGIVAADFAVPGTAYVSVQNPAPSAGASAPFSITIVDIEERRAQLADARDVDARLRNGSPFDSPGSLRAGWRWEPRRHGYWGGAGSLFAVARPIATSPPIRAWGETAEGRWIRPSGCVRTASFLVRQRWAPWGCLTLGGGTTCCCRSPARARRTSRQERRRSSTRGPRPKGLSTLPPPGLPFRGDARGVQQGARRGREHVFSTTRTKVVRIVLPVGRQKVTKCGAIGLGIPSAAAAWGALKTGGPQRRIGGPIS